MVSSKCQQSERRWADGYPELDQTLLDWFLEQRSQGKSFVGMTASDWPISHVVKKSQTIDLNLTSLSFFTGIAPLGATT